MSFNNIYIDFLNLLNCYNNNNNLDHTIDDEIKLYGDLPIIYENELLINDTNGDFYELD